MKKQIVTAIAIGITGTFPALAQDGSAPESASTTEELREQAKNPSVRDALDKPDGAAIEPNGKGGYNLFAKATAEYYFNDNGAIREAQREAEMRAKSNLVRFLKEKIASDVVIGQLTQQTVKNNKETGAESSTSVVRENVSRSMENMSNSAEAIMTGIVVLDDHKNPTSNDEGTYSVTVGVSPKTQMAAASIAKGNDASLKNRTANPNAGGGASQFGAGGDFQGKGSNVEVIRKSPTDF